MTSDKTPTRFSVTVGAPPAEPEHPGIVARHNANNNGRIGQAEWIRAYNPSTARRPSSMASVRATGSYPAQSVSQGRSTNSSPSGTATESLGSPVAADLNSPPP